MPPPGKFMVAVGAVIEHPASGKILLIRRSPDADFSGGTWENVTGRMHQHEQPMDALHREVREETGLSVKAIKPLKVFHIYRGEEKDVNEVIGIVFWCQAESMEVKLSDEHTDFRWLMPEEALKFVTHPGIKEDIRAYMQESGKTI